MSDLNFQPLLFGGDINVYSVARAFHEAYGVRSIAFGKYPSFPCHGSAILDYRVCPDNESADSFRRNVRAVAQEFPDKTVLLLGCGDSYVQLAAHCKDQLPDNVAAPYIDGALLDTLINKEKFYQLCDRYGIDHPATFIYDKSMGHDFTLPFGPPYIAKPADSVAYWATGVHALAKVYVCQSWEELLAALDEVYAAGYPDHMVLQEFIPGDDTYMRVLTNYSDRNGQVKLMCLGHVLLEEHSPHGIGNHAVIITERSPELCEKLADKALGLRIFCDEAGKMNRSLADIGGQVLVVSQFTLYGDARGGRRPSFIAAARPEEANERYEQLVAAWRAQGIHVETGRFRADMQVSLVNDGPVTILMDSTKAF